MYGVPADQIIVGNGSDELLALILRATIDPGDRVAYPVPTYSLYDTLVAVQGGEAVRLPFPPDFRLPPGLAATGARATILCNPNSPSGTFVLARRLGHDLGPLARALAARDILVRHFAVPGLTDALRITVGTDAEVASLLAAIADAH